MSPRATVLCLMHPAGFEPAFPAQPDPSTRDRVDSGVPAAVWRKLEPSWPQGVPRTGFEPVLPA
jgi:hypothetical protein